LIILSKPLQSAACDATWVFTPSQQARWEGRSQHAALHTARKGCRKGKLLFHNASCPCKPRLAVQIVQVKRLLKSTWHCMQLTPSQLVTDAAKHSDLVEGGQSKPEIVELLNIRDYAHKVTTHGCPIGPIAENLEHSSCSPHDILGCKLYGVLAFKMPTQ